MRRRRLFCVFLICAAVTCLCCKQVSGQNFNTVCDDAGRTCNSPYKCEPAVPGRSRFCVCPVDGEVLQGGACRVASEGDSCFPQLILNGCKVNSGFICTNDVCRCESPLRWDAVALICIGRSLNQPCTTPGSCTPSFNLVCTNNRCTCVTFHITDPAMNDRCIPRPSSFGEGCDAIRLCRPNINLICRNQLCSCLDPVTMIEDRTTGGCVPRPPGSSHFNQPCAQTSDCKPNVNLRCDNQRCVCAGRWMEEDLVTGGCRPRPQSPFNGECEQTVDCRPNANLRCDNQRCVCAGRWMEEDIVTMGCRPRPHSTFNGPCEQTVDCRDNVNLRCDNQICGCARRWMEEDRLTGGCKDRPPSTFNGPCEQSIDCDSTKNLECNPATMKCVCTGLNIPDTSKPGGSCALPPPSTYGQFCDAAKAYFCKPNVNLICRADQTCRCTDRWMREEPATGGCVVKPKSVLNEECEEQEDCAVGLNLHCPTRITCQCIANHEPIPSANTQPTACRRILSRYDGPCDRTADCLQSHNMICQVDNGRGLCKCEDSYDLDNGGTPCKFNPFNGRTYGQSCQASPQVRRCVVSHNLECIGTRCACLDGFVVDPSTLRDPTIGVLTCRLGEGAKNRGESCVANPSSVADKCDSLKGLDCELSNLICVCGEGYVPGAVLNDTDPCKAGVQQYGARCDPSEVIVPLQPIDPRTGLPVPGPTSPPPPVFACNITRNLVCGHEGKCVCRDEKVSERFRLDPKTGHCLITGGYACIMNEECLSKKCLPNAEAIAAIENGRPPSHSHGEKICLRSGQNGAVNSVGKHSAKFNIYIQITSSILFLTHQN